MGILLILKKCGGCKMKRFFGMMPSSEIELEEHYLDRDSYTLIIQAGKHGWSIIYADSSSEYADVDAKPDENFKVAYTIAAKNLGILLKL